MNPIQGLCCFQSLLPLSGGLVETVQQVKALAALVQLFCIFLLKDRKHDGKPKAQMLLNGWPRFVVFLTLNLGYLMTINF